MSAESILTIIGIVLMLIAIGDSLKVTETFKGFIHIKIRILLGILGFILAIYGGFTAGTVAMPGQLEQVDRGNKLTVDFPIDKVRIISPVNGDSVKCRVLAMGVYPESNDKDIWVLLKPSDDKYYPQSDHTNTSYKRNGEWQVITRFGGDKGERYDVVVYETDEIASQFFSNTVLKWKEALSFPGLEEEEIPKSAIEMERIVVSLKNNCRGVF